MRKTIQTATWVELSTARRSQTVAIPVKSQCYEIRYNRIATFVETGPCTRVHDTWTRGDADATACRSWTNAARKVHGYVESPIDRHAGKRRLNFE